MKVDIYNTDKKYNIIYADPPWHYRTWRDGQGTAEKHYPTMKIEEIVAMKDTIQKISDKNEAEPFTLVSKFVCTVTILWEPYEAFQILGHSTNQLSHNLSG